MKNSTEKQLNDVIEKAKKYDKLLETLNLKENDEIHCSFCDKPQSEVYKLISNLNVYICDECVDICNDVLKTCREEDAINKLSK